MGMLRHRRSEAQPVWVWESRDDDRIKLKTKLAALEALVGNPKRIDLVAADLVRHHERRLEAMEGKAIHVFRSSRKNIRRLAPDRPYGSSLISEVSGPRV
jgi:type I site-specific restriction-modification system R (restriction) subunit